MLPASSWEHHSTNTINLTAMFLHLVVTQLLPYSCQYFILVTPISLVDSYVFVFEGNTAVSIQLTLFYSGSRSIINLTAMFLHFGGNTAASIQLPIFYSGNTNIIKLTAMFLYLKVIQLYLYSYQYCILAKTIFNCYLIQIEI